MSNYVRKAGSRPIEKVPAGTKTSIEVLISTQEAPNFALRRFIMEPGGQIPKHTNLVEHEQYVLKGSAQVGIGDEVFTISKGDAIFIPKLVPHWYKADDVHGYEFLCIVPNEKDEIQMVS